MAKSLGRNRAIIQKSILLENNASKGERCIFLSHATKDKEAVRKIGDYFIKAGIDIYLDERDSNLQRAVSTGDSKEITKCIERGLRESTDILCVVSEDTKKSWWVPYEVGYGKKSKVYISTVLLEDVTTIPDFLEITNLLKDICDLNNFLDKLVEQNEILQETYEYNLKKSASVLKYDAINHPLSKYIKKIRT